MPKYQNSRGREENLEIDLDQLECLETERFKRLYMFLLSLTDLGIEGAKTSARPGPKPKIQKQLRPNESLIARQWGLEDNRTFVRRVLRSLYPNDYLDEQGNHRTVDSLPKIDLYKLVSLLGHLERYQQAEYKKRLSKQKNGGLVDPPEFITYTDKLKALRLFSELSLEEREVLGIPWRRGEGLLQQLLKETVMPAQRFSDDALKKLYREFIRSLQLSTPVDVDPAVTPILKKSSRQEIIRQQIKVLLSDSPYLVEQSDESIINLYEEKVNREISRIQLQSGWHNGQMVNGELERLTEDISDRHHLTVLVEDSNNSHGYMTVQLIQRLTKSVVENDLLTKKFPVFIKFIEIKKLRPLPLRIHSEAEPDGLISRELGEINDGIERQYSYCVRVFFDIDYSKLSKNKQLPFVRCYEEITGIGSPISHITAAINRTLLWDIPCLQVKNIFPIPKQLFINDEILGDSHNSPVWSHCVVQLCKEDLVHRAMEKNELYEKIDIYSEPAHGDYCGFDMVEVAAKSALYARLRAIQQLGVDPEQYIRELCNRLESSKILRHAKAALKFYPFSLWAAEGLLANSLPNHVSSYPSKPQDTMNMDLPWSKVTYDAKLFIVESLLIEGKYAAAKKHLSSLEVHMKTQDFRISDLMKARYHLLLAQYHYYVDIEENREVYPDRSYAVQAVEQELVHARHYLQARIKACKVIDEMPQSNIYPCSTILGKIYFLEARLQLTFGTYLSTRYNPQSDNFGRILSKLQQARLAAAQDGNSDDYAEYSAMQSLIYVALTKLNIENSSTYADWATRLLNHAILCYRETGNRAYQDIRQHSGAQAGYREIDSSTDMYLPNCEKFGNIFVEVVPLIQEKLNNTSRDPFVGATSDYPYSVLEIDLRAFQRKDVPEHHPETPLFGTRASFLLLVDGIIELSKCDDRTSFNQALKKMIAAYSMGKDGGHAKETSAGTVLSRDFTSFDFDEFGVSSIKGLYPHRISLVVALSSIFLLLCAALSILSNHEMLAELHAGDRQSPHIVLFYTILNDIHEKNDVSQSKTLENCAEQVRFNAHLENHSRKVIKYFKDFAEVIEMSDSIQRFSGSLVDSEKINIKWRDAIMEDIFLIMIGDSNVDFRKTLELKFGI
jgi:hypothetical protein